MRLESQCQEIRVEAPKRGRVGEPAHEERKEVALVKTDEHRASARNQPFCR